MVTCTTAPTGAAAGQMVIDEPASEPVADAHPEPADEVVDPAEGDVVAGAVVVLAGSEVNALVVGSLDDSVATGALVCAPVAGLAGAAGCLAPRAAGAAWAWVLHAAALSSSPTAETAEAANIRWALERGMRALTIIEVSPTSE